MLPTLCLYESEIQQLSIAEVGGLYYACRYFSEKRTRL